MKFSLRSLTLAAGQRKRVHGIASFFVLVSNTGTKDVHIAIENDKLSQCPKGYTYQERKDDTFFSHIDFYNPNVGSVIVEYVLSDGLVRSTPDLTADSMPVVDIADTIEAPVAIVLNAGNSYKATIAADSTQKGLEIQNNGDNDCWYGKDDASVDPATKRGIKLEVGADKIVPITCALFFESASVDCTISYMRLQKV